MGEEWQREILWDLCLLKSAGQRFHVHPINFKYNQVRASYIFEGNMYMSRYNTCNSIVIFALQNKSCPNYCFWISNITLQSRLTFAQMFEKGKEKSHYFIYPHTFLTLILQ